MRQIILFCCFLFLSGCLFTKKVSIKGKGDIRLVQQDFSTLKNWENDDHKLALQAFLHSCRKFAKMPQNRLVGKQIGDIVAGDFRDVCDIAEVVKTMSSRQTKNFFENWFRLFSVETRNGNENGLFTGYYEASLNGSFKKSEKFPYPVYTEPKNFDSERDISRAEIMDGALDNKNLEIIYVSDKVDLFFMHIQGSGRVKLENGKEVRLSYSARNKQPFIAIGNYMVEKGLITRDKINSATVREWLKNNPDRADEIMKVNPAYTFFRISENEYTTGAQGVPLTSERSLAIDNEIIPYGLPIWLETTLKKKDGSKSDYSHLMVSQDTGSAIKGTIRGDIFFGYGNDAEENASYMASNGKYYILLPINIVDKALGK